jgi:DNA-binding NtrC family response regulator
MEQAAAYRSGTTHRLGWCGDSPVMQQIRFEIETMAPLCAPVLITGESGTGKELVAKGLHLMSNRSEGPFAAVNCGSFTESLLEDTLFGHERGAFTGALGARRGVFQQADGGTLFLDEIGDLPLPFQAALLRVLDEKRVCRIGAEHSDQVDFRLITATNRDLQTMIKKQQFRLDLYHRISMLGITTVPLRDHLEDLHSLSEHLLSQTAKELGRRGIDRSALEKMAAYDWPGNVRELKNVLYRAAALSNSPTLSDKDIDIPVAESKKIRCNLKDVSAVQLERILAVHKGNIAAAARALGVPRTSLRDRILSEEQNPAEDPVSTAV